MYPPFFPYIFTSALLTSQPASQLNLESAPIGGRGGNCPFLRPFTLQTRLTVFALTWTLAEQCWGDLWPWCSVTFFLALSSLNGVNAIYLCGENTSKSLSTCHLPEEQMRKVNYWMSTNLTPSFPASGRFLILVSLPWHCLILVLVVSVLIKRFLIASKLLVWRPLTGIFNCDEVVIMTKHF